MAMAGGGHYYNPHRIGREAEAAKRKIKTPYLSDHKRPRTRGLHGVVGVIGANIKDGLRDFQSDWSPEPMVDRHYYCMLNSLWGFVEDKEASCG